MISVEYVRAQFKEALRLQEPPHRTALAFSLGVFIAFSPTYGLHFASVVFLAWAFRLNFPALLVGSLINNPWTIAPILGATLWTGFLLLGMPDVPDISWDTFSLNAFYALVLSYLLPFILGALTLSVLGAFLAYPVGVLLVSRYRKQPTDTFG